MKRNLSGWGVTVAGLLLAAAGVWAMWTGWDMILIERGWSLFIAGAVAVSGGVVTVALGRVIASLAGLAGRPVSLSAPVVQPAVVAEPAAPPPPVAIAPVAPEPLPPPPPPVVEEAAEAPAPPILRQRYGYSRGVASPLGRKAAEPVPAAPEPPTEVDRYASGGATYVMMSDGSVEVHGPDGVKRYASLAILKAEAALQSL